MQLSGMDDTCAALAASEAFSQFQLKVCPQLIRAPAARFEEEAYARLRQGFLTDQTQELLQSMHTDKHAPSAVLLRGLPCEDDLPPTGEEPPVAMVRCRGRDSCMLLAHKSHCSLADWMLCFAGRAPGRSCDIWLSSSVGEGCWISGKHSCGKVFMLRLGQ